MTTPIQARKRADLLSITGAAVVGLAAGAWLAPFVRPIGWLVLVGGLVVHAVGMTARHRLDTAERPLPASWQALYLGCWVAMMAILVFGVMEWLVRGRP